MALDRVKVAANLSSPTVEIPYKPTPVSSRHMFVRELKTEQAIYAFEPPEENEDVLVHSLLLKRITLGMDIKDPTEWHVIEMEAKNDIGKIETFPLAYLRGTDILQVSLDIMLVGAAKLKLAKGSGPVYIIGEYLKEWRDDEPIEESLVEEEEEEDDMVSDDAASEVGVESKEITTVIQTNGKRKHDGNDEVILKKQKVIEKEEEIKDAAELEPMDDAKANA